MAGIQEVGGAKVRFEVLLFDLEANDVRIPIAALDVVDRHRKAPALGMARGHRSQQVGGKGGDAAFARQVIAEKRDGSNALTEFLYGSELYAALTRVSLTSVRFSFLPVGSFLALNTARCPWHGGEALRADRLFAVDASSESAVVNPPQCGLYLAQQCGLAVHVADRQIPFRRILNLVHLVRALLDGDAVPGSQYPTSSASFRSRISWIPLFRSCSLHNVPSARTGRLPSLARDGPAPPQPLATAKPRRWG